MFFGKLCDAGMDANFKRDQVDVAAPDGAVVCTFERQVAKLKLKRPASPFGRRG